MSRAEIEPLEPDPGHAGEGIGTSSVCLPGFRLPVSVVPACMLGSKGVSDIGIFDLDNQIEGAANCGRFGLGCVQRRFLPVSPGGRVKRATVLKLIAGAPLIAGLYMTDRGYGV